MTAMAPDRGQSPHGSTDYHSINHEPSTALPPSPSLSLEDDPQAAASRFLASRASSPNNFTFRGVAVGLVIGVVICFSNMYFGLQTGWVSGMAMPSALIGFAFFKTVSRHLAFPFTPVENVLVQTVAGSLGTMPLGCGFVGVMPALEFLLREDENGPLKLDFWRLCVWSLGVCLFGVVFAVPLRKEVIVREKLKFPSGTATALMIGVLHGGEKEGSELLNENGVLEAEEREAPRGQRQGDALLDEVADGEARNEWGTSSHTADEPYEHANADKRGDWKARIRHLVIAFAASAFYVSLAPRTVLPGSQIAYSKPDCFIVFHPANS